MDLRQLQLFDVLARHRYSACRRRGRGRAARPQPADPPARARARCRAAPAHQPPGRGHRWRAASRRGSCRGARPIRELRATATRITRVERRKVALGYLGWPPRSSSPASVTGWPAAWRLRVHGLGYGDVTTRWTRAASTSWRSAARSRRPASSGRGTGPRTACAAPARAAHPRGTSRAHAGRRRRRAVRPAARHAARRLPCGLGGRPRHRAARPFRRPGRRPRRPRRGAGRGGAGHARGAPGSRRRRPRGGRPRSRRAPPVLAHGRRQRGAGRRRPCGADGGTGLGPEPVPRPRAGAGVTGADLPTSRPSRRSRPTGTWTGWRTSSGPLPAR